MQGKFFRNALCLAEKFNDAGCKIRQNLTANGYWYKFSVVMGAYKYSYLLF